MKRPSRQWNRIAVSFLLIAIPAAGGCNSAQSTGGANHIAFASTTDNAAPHSATPSPILGQSFHESPASAKVFPVAAAQPPAHIAASQIPGHFVNEVNQKPLPVPLGVHPPAPSADLIARQAAYLQQWEALRSSTGTADEQETKRAALKLKILGD